MKTISLLLLCFLLAFSHNVYAQRINQVNILVPSFQSSTEKERVPGVLGKRAASILCLQIWQTFRRPADVRVAAGFALDLTHPAPTNSREAEALSHLRVEDTQLALWGKAFQYGDGIIVQANMTIRKDGEGGVLGSDIWSVSRLTGTRRHSVSVDIPEWQYEFAPIVLDSRLVPTFSTDPDYYGTPLYAQPSTTSTVTGILGRNIKAIEHRGDWHKVIARDTQKVGWVFLPNLSEEPSEVVNFSGGVIRIFRRDWDGAIDLLSKVVSTDGNVPTAIKVDAYLYMAIASDKVGDYARSVSLIEEAYKLNPYRKETIQYLCISRLANLARTPVTNSTRAERQRAVNEVKTILSDNKALFAENDGWVKQVREFLSSES